jgi:hypothetical protein
MPSFHSWEEVLTSPDDFSFNSTVVASRDHHPPAGNLSFPNPNAPQGQAQMTSAVELWLPTPGTDDTNQTFAQWCWSTQIFQSMTMVSSGRLVSIDIVLTGVALGVADCLVQEGCGPRRKQVRRCLYCMMRLLTTTLKSRCASLAEQRHLAGCQLVRNRVLRAVEGP